MGAPGCGGETASEARLGRVDSVSTVMVDDSERDAVGRSLPYFSLLKNSLFDYLLANLCRSQELQTKRRLYLVLGHIPS